MTSMINYEMIQNATYRLPYNLQFFAEGTDKTEEPTAKKLKDARMEGQVAKSKELTTAAGLATFFVVLKLFVGYFGTSFIQGLRSIFNSIDLLSREEFTTALVSKLLQNLIISVIKISAPVFAMTIGITFIVVLAQVKWKLSGKALQPKFNKINPVNGFKKIISKDKIVDLIIELIKIVVVSYLAYNTLKNEWKTLFILYDLKMEQAILLVGNLAINMGLKISMIFLVIGLADMIYQKIKFKKDMRMSKQEVKDEYKNSEGDPVTKSKIRSKMREVSQRRMMQALPTADVVITNPTHLAAAIKYDKTTSEAPILIAKGADFLAQKIKEGGKRKQY